MKKLLFLLLLPAFGVAQNTVTVGNASTDSDSLGSQAPAFYLARTNHTGAQLTTTITGFQDSVTANTNVTANTVHITSDGSAHADVATNTTHITSDGSDHTFIDQSVISGAAPTFTTTIIDSITLNGIVADSIIAASSFTGNLANSTTQADTIFSDVISGTEYNYAADAEASDTYAVTIQGISAYSAGLMVTFLANTLNTAAATLNVNALGAKTIKKLRDQDLATGDIEAAQIVVLIYDGTFFQMISQLAQ